MSKFLRVIIVSLIFSVAGIVVALSTDSPFGTVFALIGMFLAIANALINAKYPSWGEVKSNEGRKV